MKTSAQVFTTQEVFNACFSTRHEEDLNTPKIESICLVISDFFKAEGPYKVKNKETFVFVCLFFLYSLGRRIVEVFQVFRQAECVKNAIHRFVI